MPGKSEQSAAARQQQKQRPGENGRESQRVLHEDHRQWQQFEFTQNRKRGK